MSIEFPLFTIALIVIVVAIALIGLWLTWLRVLKGAPLERGVRTVSLLAAAIVLAAWALTRVSQLSWGNLPAVTASMVGFVVAGLLIGVLPMAFWPAFRTGLRALAQTWIPRLNAVRLAGFGFLALYDMKLLPPEFALPAGLGDMAVGLLALWVAQALSQKRPYARAAAITWNILGLADFASAFVTGGLFLGPFGARAAAAGVSLHYLNYVLLIPSLGVPAYMVLHMYSLVQLLARSGARQSVLDTGLRSTRG